MKTRRQWLALAAMGAGLALSYGTLAAGAFLYLLPKRVRPRTRKLFAGRIDRYPVGVVQTFFDLEGSPILVKRGETGFDAFGSVCPHLGCRVHWEEDRGRFFCPCHAGVFDADGVATAGPPAAAGQRLPRVPVEVDEQSGIVYVEVRDVRRRKA